MDCWRGCSKFSRNNANLAIKSIQFIIFLACLIAFVWFSYDCIWKFFSCPQGVEISTQPQTALDFPSISFCPYWSAFKKGDPAPFNWTKLEFCGTDLETKFNGSKPSCQDPEEVWKDMTPRLKDFGLIEIRLFYTDVSVTSISLDENDSLWKRTPSYDRGACYSLTLPKIVREKTIYVIWVEINESKQFEIFFHSSGSLLMMDPYNTLDYESLMLKDQFETKLFINYQQKILLDFDGKDCMDVEDYDYVECIENSIQQVSCFYCKI